MRGTTPNPSPAVRAGGPIVYKEARDERSLADFEDLIAQYWDLPDETRPFVDGCIRGAFESGDRGVWLLAYKAQEPVGKAYLSLQGLDDTASIWGVYVKSTARGYGVGSRLTELALERAAELGKRRVVLGSSEMNQRSPGSRRPPLRSWKYFSIVKGEQRMTNGCLEIPNNEL